MHRQYATYIKQDAIIIKLGDIWLFYFYCTLIVVLSWPEDGRPRPKHVAKYHLIL